MRWFHTASTALFLCLLSSSGAFAADKPKPTTFHDRLKFTTAHWHELLVDGYTQHGERDPKYDDAAIAFMELVAKVKAMDGIPDFYWTESLPTVKALKSASDAVSEAGCADPVVTGFQYWVKQKFQVPVAPNRAPAALKKLPASKFDPFVVAELALTLLPYDHAADAGAGTRKLIEDRFLAAACAKPVKDRRTVMVAIDRGFETPEQRIRVVQDLEKRPDADPWIVKNLRGRLEISLAWKSRGSGWAKDVTPEGWRGFHDHLTKARDALTEAWKLAPELPQPCCEMINVAKGDDDQLGEKPIDWFERALEAQCDFDSAFDLMRDALLPRWGGSYAEMLDLAEASLAQNRYDTTLPWQYVETLRAIGDDIERPFAPLTDLKIYQKVVAITEKYAEKRPERAAYYRSANVAAALVGGHRREAFVTLQAMDAAGQALDPAALRYFGIRDASRVRPLLYAVEGPHQGELREVARQVESGDFPGGYKRVDAIIANLKRDDPSRPYFESIRRRVGYPIGEWVSLPLIPDAWKLGEGAAEPRQGGSVRFVSAQRITWEGDEIGPDVSSNFEMKVTLAFPDIDNPKETATSGIVIMQPKMHHSAMMLVDAKQKKVYVTAGRTIQKTYDVELQLPVTLRVKCVDASLTVFVNDKQVGEPFEVNESFKDGARIGLGSLEGAPVEASDVAIKQLNPPPLEQAQEAKPEPEQQPKRQNPTQSN